MLDLFSGAGGAGYGYHLAGFDVTGVDIVDQPRYPFRFVQADALELEPWFLAAFDVVHASPPCQEYSRALSHMAGPQQKLVEPVRELLQASGLPWVIENVEGAPLARASTLDGLHGVELCGTQFGLRVGRHRLFESNRRLSSPLARCRCSEAYVMNPHNVAGRKRMYAEFGRGDPEIVWRREMAVGWMGRYEAREAIPPVFTELIGAQLLDHLRHRRAA